LRAFEGTLVFVSHDRWFVGELATRIVEISPRGINDYQGTYEEYVERCGDDHLDSEAVLRKARAHKRAEKARADRRASANDNETKKRLRQVERKLEEVTQAIEKAEARVHEINETFCDPTYFERTEPAKVRKLETEQKSLTERVAELMSEWERLEQEKAEIG
jgi:ATPase subunit of ABC transporter with duplicated ATPase domains